MSAICGAITWTATLEWICVRPPHGPLVARDVLHDPPSWSHRYVRRHPAPAEDVGD